MGSSQGGSPPDLKTKQYDFKGFAADPPAGADAQSLSARFFAAFSAIINQYLGALTNVTGQAKVCTRITDALKKIQEIFNKLTANPPQGDPTELANEMKAALADMQSAINDVKDGPTKIQLQKVYDGINALMSTSNPFAALVAKMAADTDKIQNILKTLRESNLTQAQVDDYANQLRAALDDFRVQEAQLYEVWKQNPCNINQNSDVFNALSFPSAVEEALKHIQLSASVSGWDLGDVYPNDDTTFLHEMTFTEWIESYHHCFRPADEMGYKGGLKVKDPEHAIDKLGTLAAYCAGVAKIQGSPDVVFSLLKAIQEDINTNGGNATLPTLFADVWNKFKQAQTAEQQGANQATSFSESTTAEASKIMAGIQTVATTLSSDEEQLKKLIDQLVRELG